MEAFQGRDFGFRSVLHHETNRIEPLFGSKEVVSISREKIIGYYFVLAISMNFFAESYILKL